MTSSTTRRLRIHFDLDICRFTVLTNVLRNARAMHIRRPNGAAGTCFAVGMPCRPQNQWVLIPLTRVERGESQCRDGHMPNMPFALRLIFPIVNLVTRRLPVDAKIVQTSPLLPNWGHDGSIPTRACRCHPRHALHTAITVYPSSLRSNGVVRCGFWSLALADAGMMAF